MSPSPATITLHLISDSTGATLQSLIEAGLAQFTPFTEPIQKLWPQIRTTRQLNKALQDITTHPGPIFYTLMDRTHAATLEKSAATLGLSCTAVMAPILTALEHTLEQTPQHRPGLQHRLDENYFARMAAIDFAMGFDDGQNLEGIETADVILVGVSRTSKTPTCVYLARQGIRAANIPFVLDTEFPPHILRLSHPLFVGLTESPDRLIALRANRLKRDNPRSNLYPSRYIDPAYVEAEVNAAKKFFRQQGWPVLDVTKRAVEETAAEIIILLQDFRVRQASQEGHFT